MVGQPVATGVTDSGKVRPNSLRPTRDDHRLTHATLLVDDQNEAFDFHVGVLGFEKRDDDELPDDGRWVTVSPADAEFP